MVIFGPVYFPFEKPAFFRYDDATAVDPDGAFRKSAPVPALPPASSKPATPGGRMWLATWPIAVPPNASSIAWRSIAAEAALRTLMSSNGFFLVFRATQRVRPV